MERFIGKWFNVGIIIIGVLSLVSFSIYNNFCNTEESSELLGTVVQAKESDTSFNDSQRMQITIRDKNGNLGVYFIKGLTNIKASEKIYMVMTECGKKKIKIGDKLFKTYE